MVSSTSSFTAASNAGFEVHLYKPRHTPWDKLILVGLHNGAFVAGVAITLYLFTRLNKGPIRTVGAIAGITSILGIVDFGLPAWGMLTFLNIVDVFFLRSTAEVHGWGFPRTVAQMFAYPNEHATSPNPRLENVKALGLCALKYVMVNFLLYFAPSPEIWARIKPLTPAYFLYAGVVALLILGTLGFLIEAILRVIGYVFRQLHQLINDTECLIHVSRILLGVEMSPMFNNPSGASNIREFWARWNMAIKDGLSRVFFHFKAPPKRSSKSSANNAKPSASSSAVSAKNGHELRSRGRPVSKPDYLDETEASDNAASREPSPDRTLEKKMFKRKVDNPAQKKKPSSFFPKAVAATVTFAASGLFHEYMNHLAFNGASGETLVFFLTQAAGTIAYSYLKRTAPGLLRPIPTPLAILFVNIFTFGMAPLFCAPFLRAGFFEDFKAFGLLGPINGFIWFAGDGHGNYLPAFFPVWLRQLLGGK
ncbi:BQ2448_3195 [Microbotryum intermedium]|uniref:BQ2448_3195 protein n=1 Tax=Microbotryum intermedium TaxID=269621 RepID=A0A238FEH6_9BASI|nr:BQ2448_3195 [Microbotryum intermedium]